MRKYLTLKNKLYNYIRNKKCQQFFIKSKFVNKINLTSLFIFETIFNDANVIIIKTKIKKLLAIKSLTFYDFDLLLLFISEKNAISDANTIIIKTKIKYFTHIMITPTFVARSITFHKFNLLIFVSVENIILKTTIIIATLLSAYRFVSSLSLIYKSYKKLYFTIFDLYMRYASLSKFQTRNKFTRIMFI